MMVTVRGAVAQSGGLSPHCDAPAWATAWSPLASRATLGRSLPGIPSCGVRLLWGPPRVGSFWSGGNPGAAAGDIEDQRSDFATSWSRQSGSFRRPLDPGASSLPGLEARGWGTFQSDGAFAGRALIDQERQSPGTPSDLTDPFGSSPYVLTDTSNAGLRRTRVLIEGTGGWQLGDWSLGLAAGHESRENQTIESGLTRNVRSSIPGVSVGAARRLGVLTAGLHARWRWRAETIELGEVAAQGLVYDLRGYQEVPASEIVSSYYRRMKDRVSAWGGDLGFRQGLTRAALTVETTRLDLEQWRAELNDPPKDRWRTTGWRATAAFRRGFPDRWLFHAEAGYERLTGRAEDSTGVAFTAIEHALEASVSLWLQPGALHGWIGTVVLGLQHQRWVRHDAVASLSSDILAAAPWFEIELGRHLGPVLLGGGVSGLAYRPTSIIPASDRGPTYTRLIAPELGLYSAHAGTVAGVLFAQWRASSRTTAWGSVRLEHLVPQGVEVGRSDIPSGSRTAGGFRMGVTLVP